MDYREPLSEIIADNNIGLQKMRGIYGGNRTNSGKRKNRL
jgi:ribosomal protein S19E (S16A)